MQVLWLPSARRQRELAVDYIAEEDPAAAIGVLDAIQEQIGRLAEHPQLGRRGPTETTRELVIARTLYVVVYTTAYDTVRILALYHHAQKRP